MRARASGARRPPSATNVSLFRIEAGLPVGVGDGRGGVRSLDSAARRAASARSRAKGSSLIRALSTVRSSSSAGLAEARASTKAMRQVGPATTGHSSTASATSSGVQLARISASAFRAAASSIVERAMTAEVGALSEAVRRYARADIPPDRASARRSGG